MRCTRLHMSSRVTTCLANGNTETQGYQRFSDGKSVSDGNLYENTFRKGIASLLDAAAGMNIKGYSQEDATDILNEIVSLQRTGVLDDGSYMVQEPATHVRVRAIDRSRSCRQYRSNRAQQIELQLMKAEDDYLQTPAELAGC